MTEPVGKRPPPPPPSNNRRIAPRFDVVAQASITSENEVCVLSVRNLSSSGLFLEGDPADHPSLKLGTDVDIILSCSDPETRDEDIVNIPCRARIVRLVTRDKDIAMVQPAGFGATITPVDPDANGRLMRIIAALTSREAPRP